MADRVLTSPAVRRLAREHGISLAQVRAGPARRQARPWVAALLVPARRCIAELSQAERWMLCPTVYLSRLPLCLPALPARCLALAPRAG